MAICRNIQNDQFYRYLGNNKFRNLNTGKEGIVDEETAKKVFKINVEMTVMCEENHMIEEMIQRLNLKFSNNKK